LFDPKLLLLNFHKAIALKFNAKNKVITLKNQQKLK